MPGGEAGTPRQVNLVGRTPIGRLTVPQPHIHGLVEIGMFLGDSMEKTVGIH